MQIFFDKYLLQPFVYFFIYLYSYINDVGWVIIIMTIFLKIILLPLDYLSYLEEEKIKKISKRINEETKNIKDLIKKSEIISKIYKEENIHPFKSFFLHIINLPILIAFFFAIPQFLNKVNNHFFLNFIDLKAPNIFLGVLALLVQLIFIFFVVNQEQRKFILFFIILLIPIFFTFPAGSIIYILITQLLIILERKIIFTQKINKRVVSVKENNS